jgi:hypothetical protein
MSSVVGNGFSLKRYPEAVSSQFNEKVFHSYFQDVQKLLSDSKSSYPSNYQRVDEKTFPVIRELSGFQGMNVVDVGSNFGMFTLLLSGFAERVKGLERSEALYSDSLKVQDFFGSKGFDFPNVSFVNKTASWIPHLEYDALLLTLVLYHLNNDEVDQLVEDARHKAERVVIQCRPGRQIRFERGALPDYVSRTDRFDGLYDLAGNIRFLKEIGLTKIRVEVSPVLFGGEVFPVIVGSR